MGEIKIMVSSDKELYIPQGERLAQLLLLPYLPPATTPYERDKVDLEVRINKYGLIQKSHLIDPNARSGFKASLLQDC